MVATSILNRHHDPHIRKINLSRDLDRVADLIEMCFPIASDPDGQRYISQMRKSAREMRLVKWLSQAAEMSKIQASGFVWEEDDQIVGNLSLIPHYLNGSRLTMMANVAVHPDHRQQGIAKALTTRAMGYLRRQNAGHVWLQVRYGNAPAIKLYRSLGFRDRAVRTTWRIKPKAISTQEAFVDDRLTFRDRKNAHWPLQKEWLEKTYPKGIRWNYPVNFSRFTPGIFQEVVNFLDGIYLKHWEIALDDQQFGVITWQKTDSFANSLWLAFSEEEEDKILPTGLVKACKRLSPHHPISIDYPMGRFRTQFEALGFEEFRTLIWMEVIL